MTAVMIPPIAVSAFLAAHGWPRAVVVPLVGDASSRRYFRVSLADRNAVLMDTPLDQKPHTFIAVAQWLNEQGLSAPRILAHDLEKGLLLIEDFGDCLMRYALDAAALDTAALDTAALDAAAFDTAALDTAAFDTAALDTAALDTAALDTAALDTAALDTAALDALLGAGSVDGVSQREMSLYAQATDVLVHLHHCPAMAGLAPQNLEQWLEELTVFTDYYCSAVGLCGTDGADGADGAEARGGRGDATRSAECCATRSAEYRAVWRQALSPLTEAARVTVLRDYHAENIMLVAEREGLRHFGLLDFQDAVSGHPAYDLASILQDARRDVPVAVEKAMIERYVTAMGKNEDEQQHFRTAYWLLAAQRNTRILGLFVRLWKRDNKPKYCQFQPRVWGMLERSLAQDVLRGVRGWFDTYIPPAARAAVWECYT